MKNQSTLIALFSLILVWCLAGCGKEDNTTLKARILGRWDVGRIEGAPVEVREGDYYDFKSGEDDIVEVREGGDLQSGIYSVEVGKNFSISMGESVFRCKVDVIDRNNLQFTSTDGTSTKKVFLTR